MPIVGNHEYYDGGKFMRFLEQMGGIAMGYPVVSKANDADSQHSATTSLGLLLAAGGAIGGGTHGPVPSNTSRFYSVDIGLFHLVAIDMNIYWEQKSEQVYRKAQLSWLAHDLAVVRMILR